MARAQAAQAHAVNKTAEAFVEVVLGMIGGCFVLQAIPYFIAGFGVLRRRPWGRVMGFVMAGFAVGGATAAQIQGELVASLFALILAGYALTTFVVLGKRRYARAFKEPGRRSAAAAGF
jgi:hypothetical protein